MAYIIDYSFNSQLQLVTLIVNYYEMLLTIEAKIYIMKIVRRKYKTKWCLFSSKIKTLQQDNKQNDYRDQTLLNQGERAVKLSDLSSIDNVFHGR